MAKRQNAPKKRRRPGRKEKSLDGTNLYRDTRTGKLWWRRTCPITRERLKKPTGTTNLEYALRKAAEFDDELEKRAAGIKVYDAWKRPLLPLVEEWFTDQRSQDVPPQERWLVQKEKIVRIALDELKLKTAADLTDVGRVDRRLKALKKPYATLRRRYQDPLRQFSAWLAENGRYLEHDPLANWKPISYQADSIHRAFSPEGVARAFVAADWLDTIHHRKHPLRIVFEVLLITAPRAEALTTRDLTDYRSDETRIDYGAGVGKKLRGQGKLDHETAACLADYLGEREDGPLFYSPRGGRIEKRNLLRWWREAFSLGVVWELWPEQEEWSVDLAHFVNQTLMCKDKQARIPAHGNPDLVSVQTRRARRALGKRVQQLADTIGEVWEERMENVTLHSFRHTHQTWARASGVDQVLVNLQVGWKASAGDSFDQLRAVASSTGLKRYLDAKSKLLDSRRSAEAVRELLNEGLAAVLPSAGSPAAVAS